MKKIIKISIAFLLFIVSNFNCNAQLYPVQLTPIFKSPYSIKISDYAASMDTKMQLLINPTDLSINNRQVRLKLYIQGNGLNIQSSDYVQGQKPIYINGGELQTLTNTDIASLFRLENLQGITASQYALGLPEGAYSFCFEMYDFVTNQKISQKSCASLYLILNDPPLLNTPQKNEQIAESDFPNIIFTWTPRQINATNVSYKFELKQLLDPSLDPQIVFQMAPVLYEETLFGTALLYNLSMPVLTPGMRYAWRVRAVSTTGLSENAIFKNDGYSEIYSFKYTQRCNAPTFALSEIVSPSTVKITWQGTPDHTKYQVQYRKKAITETNKRGKTTEKTFEWFSSYSLNNQVLLTNLEPETEYEFRVGSSCTTEAEGIQSFTYSNTNTFAMPKKENAIASYNCGIKPNLSITNKTPLNNLIQSETFTAGDFPVTVLELGKEHSPYTGKGYIIVPYLADTKIAVEFKDILINTDYQLISGVVETAYNSKWDNVVDVSNLLESAQTLINQIKTAIEEQLEAGILTKDEADNFTEQYTEQEEILNKVIDNDKLLQEQIANEKEADKEISQEQKDQLEANNELKKDVHDKLQEIASKLNIKTGSGSRETDGYFQGLLPLANSSGTIQLKQVDGNGFVKIDSEDTNFLKTYSATISGKKYTFVFTTSNSSKEKIDEAKKMTDNPTDGIVIYNHYDFKKNKLGYKVNFSKENYRNSKGYTQESLTDLFAFGLNNELDNITSASDWGSEIFKLASLLDDNFQNIIDKGDSSWFTKEGLEEVEKAIDFLQKCKTLYATQEGYIPRCLWDHNKNISYVSDMAFSSGFADGLIETGVGTVQMVNFAKCWNFTEANFYTANCTNIRLKTIEIAKIAYQTFSDFENFKTVASDAWGNIKDYTDETASFDNQGRYNQGKIVFNVVSLFIGAGEAKAIIKGETTLVAVIKESALAYRQLPKAISKAILKSSKNLKVVLQKTGTEFYLFYKLNTTELKLGTIANGTFKPDHWLTVGERLEKIENCVYLSPEGKIVTSSLEVVRKDGVVGVKVVEGVEKFNDYINGLVDANKFISEGKFIEGIKKIDLMGGKVSQLGDNFVNIDIQATKGINGSVTDLDKFIKSNSIDEIVCNSPQVEFLEQASIVMKKDAKIYINGTLKNKYFKHILKGKVEQYGFKVLEEQTILNPRFKNLKFYLSDSMTEMDKELIKTTILIKE
ncbi:fibronectin type III domain-containing protein [Flavobacterium sp.]|uniref:fibronectin type III domain-containing protein n=1 Tax=Flavobacterium sp. TaxID=239 RepID=UPI0031D74E22